MSYQVIARKWRPGAFKEVVGQDHVVRTLSNAVNSGRIGHAFIFSGPRGVGKTTIARILARCLNCAEGPTAEPCLKCSNCVGITGGSLVDVLEIDGASNNSVENVREICESVRYAPATARYKIYIIDEVHMLSTSAFNALLKTLEEPPPHVVFIFATTEPQKIPLTIHSRCQRFEFRRIPLKQIISHLTAIAVKEGIEASPEAIFMISREADGSLRDAQSLLEQVISFSGNKLTEADIMDSLGLMDRGVVFELSGAVLGGDGAAALNMVEKIHEFGYDFKKVTAELLEHIRDLVVVKVSGPAILELPESELERLVVLSGLAGLERLETLFGLFTGGYAEVARSTTPRFAFEMMLVRASLLEDLRPIGELIAGLEKIGKPGRGGRGTGSGGGQRRLKRNEAAHGIKPAGRDVLDHSPRVSSDSSPVGSSDSSPVGSSDSSPVGSSDSSPRVLAGIIGETSKGEASAKESKDEASAKESRGGVIKTTSGLLDFIKASDTITYNRLRASRLLLEGGRLKVVASPGDVNFLRYVKKDALAGFCRDYFRTNIRLEFEKHGAAQAIAEEAAPEEAAPEEAAPEEAAPEEATPEEAATQAGAEIAVAVDTPPFPEPESFPVIDERPAVAGAAALTVEKPEAAPVCKGAGNNGPERVDGASLKVDTVLKDTLAVLGGKVIDSRRITNV